MLPVRPQIASARGRRARARRAASPPLARASRARGAAPAAVVEEPARLRRPRLRGQARRPAALAGGVRLLRRLLRGLERFVPGQRRARPCTTTGCTRSSARGRSRAVSSRRARALTIAGGLALLALLLVAPLGLASVLLVLAFAGPAGRLHAAAEARRAARRADDRGAVRDPRGRGRRSGGRADLRLAAALHRAARALPRAGQAPRRARARRRRAHARPAGARGLLARARRPADRDRRLRDGDRVRRSTRSRPATRGRCWRRCRSSSSASSATCC